MMKKYRFLSAWTALILVLSMILSAVSAEPYTHYTEGLVPYSEMVYTRPDLQELQELADRVKAFAEENRVSDTMSALADFYEAYDWYMTCEKLTEIHYNADLSDKYWQEEYTFCNDNMPFADRVLEEIYAALAAAPCRRQLERNFFGPGFFAAYDGWEGWSEEEISLMEQEQTLINRYYSLLGEESDTITGILFGRKRQLAQTLVDLIRLRHRIAEAAGYDSYIDYANENAYYREFTAEEMRTYLEAIRQELVPMYRALEEPEETDCTVDETFAYVRSAAKGMGGIIGEAFDLLETAGLYDIAPGDNRVDTGFEFFLDTYSEPFVFITPWLTSEDKLTFAHEFGHFCNDYASSGSYVSMDVAEIFSQGMEYLSLSYAEGGEELVRLKLYDSLGTYVAQACFASFEMEIYSIPADQLSVRVLKKAFDRALSEYGMERSGFQSDDFVYTTHHYIAPMYIFSYIISNDAALQYYEMERTAPGEGLAAMTAQLDTEELWFLTFITHAGLESPFTPGRLQTVKSLFQETLAA